MEQRSNFQTTQQGKKTENDRQNVAFYKKILTSKDNEAENPWGHAYQKTEKERAPTSSDETEQKVTLPNIDGNIDKKPGHQWPACHPNKRR